MSFLLSARPTIVDRIFSKSLTTDILLVTGGAALTAAAAQVTIPMFPVPMTGQTFAVLLVAATLGLSRSALSMILYVLVGSLGAPIFAAGTSGFFGFTMGYLIGFVAAAVVVGYLAEKGWDRTPLKVAASFALGSLVIYAFGVSWLSIAMGLEGYANDLVTSLAAGMLPFLIGDALKAALAAALLPSAWAAIKKIKG
jgi:biotin transport system substrate-specific component